MRPDDFDDSIRRKLDSIEPNFREKDWVQMQQVMRQHGLISPWSAAPPWLMPAAGLVSVAALLTTTVWLGQSNQQLRQDVQRLNQTVTQLKQTPEAVPARVDTVYLTRTLPSPSTNRVNPQSIESNVSVSPSVPPRDNAVTTPLSTDALSRQPGQDSVAEQPTVTTNAPADRVRPAPAGRPGPPTTSTIEPVQGRQATDPTAVVTVPADATGNRVARTTETGRNRNAGGTNRPGTERPAEGRGRVETTTPSATAGSTGVVASSAPRNASAPADRRTGAPEVNGPASGPVRGTTPMVLEKLASRPLRPDSVYFDEGISRAIRRLRRLYPARPLPTLPAAPTTAPEATAVVTPNDRFRLGVAGEVGLKQWSLGVYGDVLLGRHLLFGLGLERVSISGGEFSTDILFKERTRRDFRGYYAPGIDNRHLILNISRRSFTWQVPVTLGYRIPVGAGIALTPAVGISTSLSAYETVRFTYADLNRKGPYELREAQLPAVQRPVAWYHSWSTSLGVEKRWGPVIVQASPYLVGPFTNGPLGLNGTSGGLRLRTLYAF